MFETIEKELAMTAQKARESGCWFYCMQTQHWLTPEEFEMQGKCNLITWGNGNRDILANYRMRDPRDGIRSGMATAKKAATDLQEFSEKVFAYFNQVAKDKK